MLKGSNKGVGSGQWGVGMGKRFPYTHSQLPIPHSLFTFFRRMLNGSKEGVGSGQWGVEMGKQFPYPHSPIPIPHSLLVFFAIFVFFASFSTFTIGADSRVAALQSPVSIRWTS